jgi:sigma-B regulation protein RsbU (phosphoserine phosphatase)
VQDINQISRILVVDDEEMNREMLARRLRRRGFTVECADGAAQADQQIQKSPFDLIVLDIMMPGVDGFEYLQQVRQRWEPSQLPVIMATAKTDTEDVVRALEMGANDYVTKPLDFKVVMARVETQLRLKHTTEQLSEAHRLLKDDLERAARFQRSLLPRTDLKVRGCNFAWSYLPCDALAGDFLNVIPLDESSTAFYILDVSGHGTPAALMSAAVARALSVTDDESSLVARKRGKGIIRGSRIDVVPPSEVTARLNRQFELDTRDGKYFTMAYVVIDVDAKEMQYTLAGHPSQIVVPIDRECELLECRGVPVGLLRDHEIPEDGFQTKRTPISIGDRIYLFSDGVTEATNAEDQRFEIVRLCDAINQTRSLPLDQSIERILATISDYCGERPVDDDMSIIAIEITDQEESGSE